MDRAEILERYSQVKDADDIVATYTPLISEIGAHTVVVQMTTAGDQLELIDMLGREVLPKLREL